MATIIFKPTEACNARCIYCDVVHKEGHSSKRMSFDTLEKFFVRIDEFLNERPDETLELIWHGGEPLLLGPKYFAKAGEFQRRHCANTGKRIKHNIQSNLTAFTRELAKPLRELGVDSFGSSYEPIDNIRGLGPGRNSRAYNKKFLENIRLVEEEGFSWGVIYVVTKLALSNPLAIFQFMSNLSPKGAFMFNPVLVYTRELDHIKISPEEYVEFLGAIFPEWWRRRDELPHVEPFASVVRNLLGTDRSLVCSDSGTCAHHHINVQADGSISHCGRSADWGLLNYGSIFDKTFAQVFQDAQRSELLDRNKILPETECKGCRFWEICHGGCPLDAWSASGSFLHKSNWCYVKRGFIERFVEPIIASNGRAGGTAAPASVKEDSGNVSIAVSQSPRTVDLDGVWINPVGGLGDTLMMSGVLKAVVDLQPQVKFNLVERAKYRHILEGHPAINRIGHPPPDAKFMATNYWDQPEYRVAGERAYQVMAHMFGLPTPVEERLYVPWEIEPDTALTRLIPWKRANVLICQSSNSPRKQMSIGNWEKLVAMLALDGIGVVQIGRLDDRYVRGAHSMLGLTTPRQAIGLIPRFDAVVTSDNFILHAAAFVSCPRRGSVGTDGLSHLRLCRPDTRVQTPRLRA